MSENYEQNHPLSQQDFQNVFSNYFTISDMLKTYSYDEILRSVAVLIGMEPEKLEQYPMGGYSKGMTSGAYRFVLQDLLRNIVQYDWLYSKLEDEASRLAFANLVGYRVFPVPSFLKAACDSEHPQYFDKSIVFCNKDEVFVDCGCLAGDTTESFIRQFNNYKHIYAYEPAQDNIQICRDNLKKYHNVTVCQCGVGEKSNILSIERDSASSFFMESHRVSDSEKIQMISLDEDIQESITFLKMDIEGFEIPALLGAKRHIRDDFPKLAICTHHIISGLWEIPRLIDAMHPGYRFFIRHYDFHQNQATVFYAIPPEQVKETQIIKYAKSRKRIISLPAIGGWQNAHLLKDCGVIPYLFYKNYHCDTCMVGVGEDETYFNARYVKGLKMEFLPDGGLQTKAYWIVKEAPNIDCLLIHGCYVEYFPLVSLYKKYNPQGKISLILDANSYWMDRIQWTDPAFCQFMDQCDVISTSGHIMQRHLNEKWPWIIEYIPNGFYNFSSKVWNVDFKKKENIILTAARLGNPEKATPVLLEAFAQIAERIPDWKLHLAGSIEQGFESYLTQFWKQYPHLQHRIRFLERV